jgi:hypothetical protein
MGAGALAAAPSVEPRQPEHADERGLREQKADSDAGDREQDGRDADHADGVVIGGCAPDDQMCSPVKSSLSSDSKLLSISVMAVTEPALEPGARGR